jgi:hypothetical protein
VYVGSVAKFARTTRNGIRAGGPKPTTCGRQKLCNRAQQAIRDPVSAGNNRNPAALGIHFSHQRHLLLRRPLPAARNNNLAIDSKNSFWTVQKDSVSLSAFFPTTHRRPVQTGRLRWCGRGDAARSPPIPILDRSARLVPGAGNGRNRSARLARCRASRRRSLDRTDSSHSTVAAATALHAHYGYCLAPFSFLPRRCSAVHKARYRAEQECSAGLIYYSLIKWRSTPRPCNSAR